MIVGFCTMSIKNTVEVYRRSCRSVHLKHVLVCTYIYMCLLIDLITLEHGLFDQIRVDHGREWYFILAVQQQLSPLHLCQDRVPYLQTTSNMVWAVCINVQCVCVCVRACVCQWLV